MVSTATHTITFTRLVADCVTSESPCRTAVPIANVPIYILAKANIYNSALM